MSHSIPRTVHALASGVAIFVLSACAKQQCEPPRSALQPMQQTAAPVPAVAGPIQRVILVTIDGLKPENYLRPDEKGLKVPTLRRFVEQGAISDGVTSVFPTLTYPSHTSIVTGVTPSTHRIVANRTFDPFDNDLEGWRWYAEDIAVDPIWRVAQQNGVDTAMIHWPVSVGAAVKWLVPEYWRAKNLQDQKVLRSVSTPGLLESVAREHPDFWSRYLPPAVTDDSLTDIALYILSVGKPRLLFLHLVEVDGAQHGFGIDSPEARTAIEESDRQIARILETLNRLNLAKETAVVVASDHGFRTASKMVRPCTLLTQAGLATTDGKKLTSWKATVHSNSGQAYVYVKDPADEATRAQVRQIFAARQNDPSSGIDKVYENAEIRQLGGDPEAFLALEPATDFQFGAGCVGDYVAPRAYRATHGFDPRGQDMQASLLMIGPSIPHGRIPGARLIDIAPTIAQWLGLPLPDAEGVPLRVVAQP